MKNPNTFKTLALTLLLGVASGCSGYLDTVPVDKSSPNTFLKGIEQAKSMLAGIYYCFYDDSPAYITPYTYENMCDNSYNHHTWEFSAEFAQGTQTAASWWAELKWTKDWQAISRANTLIRSMALASGISETDSRKILAEARFLRAWFYFDLVRFYGRVPLVDENSPQENAPREDLDKVLAFIKEDVKYAVTYLDNILGGEVACQGSAQMLKLQIAQYEYDHETVIECARAIQALGYDLYGDFRKLFLDEGINDPANREVIFKVVSSSSALHPLGAWIFTSATFVCTTSNSRVSPRKKVSFSPAVIVRPKVSTTGSVSVSPETSSTTSSPFSSL